MKIKLFLAVFILLAIVVGYFIFKSRNNSTIKFSQYSKMILQRTNPEVGNFTTEIPTSTSTPIEKSLNTDGVPVNGAIRRGQVVCDYVVPAAPDSYGTANIESNWNNTNVSVCVAVNGGGSTLIANDQEINGERRDKADWISLNTTYQFNLYSGLSCNGNILSSCQISQSAPTKAPFSH